MTTTASHAQTEQVANHLRGHGSEGRRSQFDGVWNQRIVTRHDRVEYHEQGHRVFGSDTIESIHARCAGLPTRTQETGW